MAKNLSRQELLNYDLINYHPKKWKVNTPFLDYTLRGEDLIPAFAGTIGKSALIAAFAIAWAAGLNISDPTFATENVRLELMIASVLTLIFCAVLNPYAGPPGTLAPLIPLIPLMAASGVHPLPLSLLIGLAGLIISYLKYFRKIVEINQTGTKGGIIILFGFMGISSSLDNLKKWSGSHHAPELFTTLLLVGLILYIFLGRMNLRWMVIPACAAIALGLSAVYNLYPEFKTPISVPIINPNYWWNVKWGIGWGLTPENFIKALPFTMLALVMWPLDALAIKTIQETNYPKEANRAIFKMNTTYIIVSVRNIVGVILGGSQIAAVWRSFMIPLGIVKRPIGGSALLLSVVGLSFGFLGFPIDIAVFPPLLWLVLIFGVYIPLLEVGLNTLRTAASAQIATICLFTGMAVSPVLGWVVAISIENFRIINDPAKDLPLSRNNKIITIVAVSITLIAYTIAH